MRPLIFLFPHNHMDVGGNSAQVNFVQACRSFASVTMGYYGSRIFGQPYLDDILEQLSEEGPSTKAPIFIVHWGPDIGMLLGRLVRHDVIYVAHSTGWSMALPPRVPILCVSRHTMAYWGRHAPNSYIGYLPNILGLGRASPLQVRDIDVLVQTRKSSNYLIKQLVPALAQRCRIEVLDGWVDDLNSWFLRSKVYLYDSLEHWIDVGATEGFGLPPLEAMGQGCIVFSSVNDALADYLDPGFNCRKIRVHSLTWDVSAILRAVEQATPAPPDGAWFDGYMAIHITERLKTLLGDIECFFAATAGSNSDIEDLWEQRRPSTLQRAKRAATNAIPFDNSSIVGASTGIRFRPPR